MSELNPIKVLSMLPIEHLELIIPKWVREIERDLEKEGSGYDFLGDLKTRGNIDSMFLFSWDDHLQIELYPDPRGAMMHMYVYSKLGIFYLEEILKRGGWKFAANESDLNEAAFRATMRAIGKSYSDQKAILGTAMRKAAITLDLQNTDIEHSKAEKKLPEIQTEQQKSITNSKLTKTSSWGDFLIVTFEYVRLLNKKTSVEDFCNYTSDELIEIIPDNEKKIAMFIMPRLMRDLSTEASKISSDKPIGLISMPGAIRKLFTDRGIDHKVRKKNI